MTDVRKCDGPGCEISAPLDGIESVFVGNSSDYIVLSNRGFHHADLHFHNNDCMTTWVKENTRASK